MQPGQVWPESGSGTQDRNESILSSSQPFWQQGPVLEDNFSMDAWERNGSGDDSSILHLLCTLLLI